MRLTDNIGFTIDLDLDVEPLSIFASAVVTVKAHCCLQPLQHPPHPFGSLAHAKFQKQVTTVHTLFSIQIVQNPSIAFKP